jgi:hypothetical protein
MRRVTFFYTWTRRNIPFWAERLLNPRHARQNVNIGRAMGYTEMTPGRDELPEYAQERGYGFIPTPDFLLPKERRGKGEKTMFNPGASFQDIGAFSPTRSANLGEAFMELGRRAAAQASPIPKIGIEAITGKDLYSGREHSANVPTTLGPYLKSVGLDKVMGYSTHTNYTTGEVTAKVKPRFAKYLKWVPFGRLISSLKQLEEGDLVRMGTGIHTQQIRIEQRSMNKTMSEVKPRLRHYIAEGVLKSRGSEFYIPQDMFEHPLYDQALLDLIRYDSIAPSQNLVESFYRQERKGQNQ